MNELNANFDEPWKEAIADYFEDFLIFFFPEVHSLIDWSKPPQSLDKELQQITAAADTGKRLADKLFQVWLLDNRIVWILIHIEVQSQYESDFSKRMYIYNYRAFDLYEKPVISLAVLGDERVSWRPNSYGYAFDGCAVSFTFPIVKLLDYETRYSELEQNTNPFAVMVMAHLKTKATTGKPTEREQWKWRLVRGLYERGYNRESIVRLFQLIDVMMTLPSELQYSFNQKVERFEEEQKMPLLSNIELRAIERGLQQGLEQGLEQGLQQGLQQGTKQNLKANIISLLQKRFETIPPELLESLNNLDDVSRLQELLLETISVNSVAEFALLLPQK